MSGVWCRMALGLRLGCWAICSGRPSAKVRGRFARLHRTLARVESEWERELITLRSRCRHCGKTRLLVRATGGADNPESPPLHREGGNLPSSFLILTGEGRDRAG